LSRNGSSASQAGILHYRYSLGTKTGDLEIRDFFKFSKEWKSGPLGVPFFSCEPMLIAIDRKEEEMDLISGTQVSFRSNY
jgi:hypothetical protein